MLACCAGIVSNRFGQLGRIQKMHKDDAKGVLAELLIKFANRGHMDNEINTEAKLTHVDRSGQASMVDVSEKKPSTRRAVATGFVAMTSSTLALIKANNVAKGDVLATARIAGIQGAKQCPTLIPLCHPLMLSKVVVDFDIDDSNSRVNIRCECKLTGATGVEMEALTGVSVAALTIFDMCKAADPNMLIGDIKVLSKEGGKTGDWRRTET